MVTKRTKTMRQTLRIGQPMTPQKSYFNRKRRQWRNDKMKGIRIWHVYKRHKDKKARLTDNTANKPPRDIHDNDKNIPQKNNGIIFA